MQNQRESTAAEDVERLFALRMRQERTREGTTQTSLASDLERFGLSLDGTAVTRIEKNARVIRLGEAWAISRALGFTLENLLQPEQPTMDALREARKQLEVAVEGAQLWHERAEELRAYVRQLENRLAESLDDE